MVLLSDKNIGLLVQKKDNATLILLTREVIKAAKRLPLRYVFKITERMKSYASHDECLFKEIENFERSKRNQYRMAVAVPWMVFLVAVLVCIFIYFLR